MKPLAHQYEDKLLELAYGELDGEEKERVQRHVQGCARCSAALEEIRGVRVAMSRLPLEPAPAAGLESLLEYAEQAARRNREARPTSPSGWRWRALAALGLASALAAVVVVVAWREERAAEPPVAVAAAEAPPLPDVVKERAAPAEPERKAAPDEEAPAPVDKQPARRDGVKVVSRAKDEKPRAVAPAEALTGDSAPASPALDRVANAVTEYPGTLGGRGSTSAGLGLQTGEAASAKQDAPAAGGWGGEPGRARSEKVALADAEEQRGPPAPGATLPAAAKKSLQVGGLATAAREDEAAVQELDVVQDARRLDQKAGFEARQQTAWVRGLLDEARAAAARRETSEAVRLGRKVLESGAQGASRAEALQLVCEGLELLGEAAQARPACEALAREFPDTAFSRGLKRRPAERTPADEALQQAAPAQAPAPPAPLRKAAPVEQRAPIKR